MTLFQFFRQKEDRAYSILVQLSDSIFLFQIPSQPFANVKWLLVETELWAALNTMIFLPGLLASSQASGYFTDFIYHTFEYLSKASNLQISSESKSLLNAISPALQGFTDIHNHADAFARLKRRAICLIEQGHLGILMDLEIVGCLSLSFPDDDPHPAMMFYRPFCRHYLFVLHDHLTHSAAKKDAADELHSVCSSCGLIFNECPLSREVWRFFLHFFRFVDFLL